MLKKYFFVLFIYNISNAMQVVQVAPAENAVVVSANNHSVSIDMDLLLQQMGKLNKKVDKLVNDQCKVDALLNRTFETNGRTKGIKECVSFMVLFLIIEFIVIMNKLSSI